MADRVVLVEIDYQYESAGVPATGTLRLATKSFFDDVNEVVYADAVRSIPQYTRALSGENFGVYQSSIGSIEIDNPDGEYDYVLALALDNSEVRVLTGDLTWVRADFIELFTAVSVRATAPSASQISILLKDSGAYLNRSLGGDVTVGGIGANADRQRPINFGYVRQVECLIFDEATLTYVHSDTGTNTEAIVVRDRGLETTATDNGDGTLTLSVSPDGQITADVLAATSMSDRRVSDAFDFFVGERGGLSDLGKYAGAGASFTVGDADDYQLGIHLTEATNLVSFLSELVASGNCFWAILRDGRFTFGRLRPDDIAGLGMPITELEADDMDSMRISHSQPKYHRIQAYMNKNWSVSQDLATSLTSDERAALTRDGLHVFQAASVGTTYAAAPELYHLSLQESPIIETWISDPSEDDSDLVAWEDTRRDMTLPWLQTLSCTVGIEFYELELGDTVRVTMSRFGLDSGELFQVTSVNLRATPLKVDLELVRRVPAV